jgi:hypothetical protein
MGTLTIGGNLTLAAGSTYIWKLANDTTGGPGVQWDQVRQTAGTLSVDPGAVFLPEFVGFSTLPTLGQPFWRSPQRWENVIQLTGTATNPGGSAFTIDNTLWSVAGTFSTAPGLAAGGIDLVWTPVPEPASVLGLCVAAAGACGLGRKATTGRRRAREG